MAFEHAVVLTGGIATGKSTAAEMFRARGFALIDADTVAHEMLAARAQEVAQMFGSHLLKDGEIDRSALGQIVFADAASREKLERLLHPLIEAEITRQARQLDAGGRPYLIDIPLFYEREAYPIEPVIVVYAPRALQIERLMARNGLSETEALQRLDAQMDIEAKKARATWVIDNTADRKHLQDECARVAADMV